MREPEFFFLAKTIAIADQAGAQYVPPEETDLNLLRCKLESIGKGSHVQARPKPGLLQEVARVLVPDFDLDAKTAVAMRRSAGVSAITTGMASWIWKMYRSPTLEGSQTVIASVIRKANS